jgi:GNAT superfamily N-acetyltransferase
MIADLVIRPAEAADVPALHHLIESAYRGDSARQGWTHEADLLGGQRIDAEALYETLADPAQHVLLAFADDRLIGSVTVSDKGDGIAYLGLLSVDPLSQAAGIGRRLIGEAERLARDRFGARLMEMTVVKQRGELIAFYERRGYALTGEERPFPYGELRFGEPNRADLYFVVLARALI